MASEPPDPRGPAGREKGKGRRGGRGADSSLVWIGAGFELAGAVAILALLGYGIDAWLGTEPWGLVVGAMIGIVGGLYNLIKQAIRNNR